MTMKAWNAAILGTAIIWAGVIIATAFLLAGTDCFGPLIPILGGGAAGSLIVLAGARGATAGTTGA
jgi:malic enzyme